MCDVDRRSEHCEHYVCYCGDHRCLQLSIHEVCHMWMICVTWEWVCVALLGRSQMPQHSLWMRHVMCEYFASSENECVWCSFGDHRCLGGHLCLVTFSLSVAHRHRHKHRHGHRHRHRHRLRHRHRHRFFHMSLWPARCTLQQKYKHKNVYMHTYIFAFM